MTGDKRWELGGDRLCSECSDTGLVNHFISPTRAFSTLPFSTKLHPDLLVSYVFVGSMVLAGLSCLPSAMEKKPLLRFSCVPSLTCKRQSKLSTAACK